LICFIVIVLSVVLPVCESKYAVFSAVGNRGISATAFFIPRRLREPGRGHGKDADSNGAAMPVDQNGCKGQFLSFLDGARYSASLQDRGWSADYSRHQPVRYNAVLSDGQEPNSLLTERGQSAACGCTYPGSAACSSSFALFSVRR